jgi:glycine C-acetyltransferase
LVEQGFDIGVTDTMVTPVFLKGDLTEATSLNYGAAREARHILLYCGLPGYP